MRRETKYILQGHTPVPEPDPIKWAMWMETANRVVGRNELPGGLLSTVFLGLDHQFGKGPPLLFETMLFTDGEENDCWRCSTWEQAVAQHQMVLQEWEQRWSKKSDVLRGTLTERREIPPSGNRPRKDIN